MTEHFSNILNVAGNQVSAPPTLPRGHYLAMVESYEEVVSGKKKTPGIQFNLKLVAPGDDVAPGELAEAGGIPDRSFRHTLWCSPNNVQRFQYDVRVFLIDTLGLSDGAELLSLLPHAQGRTCKVFVEHELTDDGRTFPTITRVMAT